MKPKKDPIKPSKVLNKKPNFKKEKLDDEFIKVSLAGLYGHLGIEQDYILSSREPREERRVFNVNVGGELNDNDIQGFIERMRTSMMIPQQYFGSQETEVVGVEQIRTQQEFENIYGELDHPIGISSRQRQNTDGSLDLLGYDLVASPSTRSAILGGEEMAYNASTWMTLNKKKTKWEKMKDYFSSIYKRWRHVE
jgi:hypothetical protein